MLRSAIESGKSLPAEMERLERETVERLSESAINSENLPALMSLAKINKKAVSNSLRLDRLTSLGRIAGKGGVISSRLYFVMRGELDPKRRRVFRRLARTSLLKQSLRIAGEGLRGDINKQARYQPGMDFDLEKTIEQTMESYPDGIPLLGLDDIVGIDRIQRKKSGVLILDTSGSMVGERNINAALTAAIMAYSMRKDEYSVIAFNTKAFMIKKFSVDVKVQDIVDRILDLEAIGHTNIEDGLKLGGKELKKLKTRFKWAILFTDGVYNKGKDPRYLAKEFKKLHIINLPGKKWGVKVCQDLARLSGGKYVAVNRYQEAPRALMKILRSPWS
ncbi:MAG: vWA domain-containing protein [Candidatus Hodarchaeales archaeon]|jgi:Mg-chelatase subunit ChlD